eukprot:Partr_v1_DN26372_c0_g1_i3_m43012 putative 3phosphoinositidedependent protein kinase
MEILKKQVGDYQLGSVLGEGSYSTVVEGTDQATGKVYAIKVLEKRHIVKEKKTKYVAVEKQVLSMLHHPFIVRLYSTFQDSSSLYFVLELGKRELLHVIRSNGGMDVDSAAFYAAEVVLALDHMHLCGVVHRDLKPENILLDASMHVKVTDFGTAKILSPSTPSPSPDDGDGDTASGRRGSAASFVGTAEYVSPELLNEKRATAASDVWALGCVIYQMVVNKPPFKAANDYMMFQKITKLDYSFPSYCPVDLKELVQSILVPAPGDRPGLGDICRHLFFGGLCEYLGSDDILHVEMWKVLPPPISPFVPVGGWSDDVKREQLQIVTPNSLQTQPPLLSPLLSPMSPVSPTSGEDWSRFLYDGENILYSGVIQKKRYFFGKARTRHLILTDKPRLMYVDPDNMVEKGEIPWGSDLQVELKDDHSFAIISNGRTWLMNDVEGNAQSWVQAIVTLKNSVTPLVDSDTL